MNFKDYLLSMEICTSLYNKPENIEQICDKNICTKRDFDDYESFSKAVSKSLFIEKVQPDFWKKSSNVEKINWIKEFIDIRSGIGLPVWSENLQREIFHPDDLYQSLEEYFSENPKRYTLHEVELGLNYALILSNNAGNISGIAPLLTHSLRPFREHVLDFR